MILEIGDRAPDFRLLDGNGKEVTLADFQGQWLVLYFYPRDNTPGCTKEACGFRDLYSEYQMHPIAVLGVSPDDAKAHTKFTTKYQLPFPLLCDPEGQVATAYGCYGLKKFMGKEYLGITRTTFLINPDARIEKIYRKVKPELHAQEILTDFVALSPGGKG